MTNVRLLRVVGSMDPVKGGVAEAIRQFGLVAGRMGCDLSVVCMDPPDAPHLPSLGFNVVGIGSRRNRYNYGRAIARWLRDNVARFDVVIIDGLWMFHGWAVRSACLRAHIPYCVMPHGMLDPWFKRYLFKHFKKSLYWLFVEHRVVRDAAAVIFTAREEARKAQYSFWPYSARAAIAPLGVQAPPINLDSAVTTFRSERLGGSRRPYVLFIGRLTEKKGVDQLIIAYERYRDNTSDAEDLVIAGPGLDSAFGAKLLKLSQNIPNVHFTGMLQGNEKWGALAGANAMILPSHQENFGVVVAESLSVGVPVLISRQVDIWKEVCESGAGFADDDTEQGIHALLTSLHALSDAARNAMRTRALACYQAHFDAASSARQTLDILRGVCHPTMLNEPGRRR